MDKIHEEIKKFSELKILVRVLKTIGIIIVVMLIFEGGIVVGFHKASFGENWGENYSENFGFGTLESDTTGTGMLGYSPNGDGAIGKILKVELPGIIVQDRDNTEKALLVNASTKIQKGRNTILASDLQADDFIVVIGSPDAKGVIDAKFIRVIPSPNLLK